MTPEEIFAIARRAIAAGESPRAVDRGIAEYSGGRYTTYASLAQSVRQNGGEVSTRNKSGGTNPSAPDDARFSWTDLRANERAVNRAWDPENRGLLDNNDRYAPKNAAAHERAHARDSLPPIDPESARSEAIRLNMTDREYQAEYARAAMHGASMGLRPRIVGAAAALGALYPGGKSPAQAYTSTRDRELAKVEAFRAQHGRGAELAGGLLSPGLGAAKAGVGAAVRAGRVAAGMRRGAVVGGATGGLLSLGADEDLTDRGTAAGVAKGIAKGAAIGVPLGGAGAVATRAGRAAKGAAAMDDVAEEFGRRAGVPGGNIGNAVEAAKQARKAVSSSAYSQLDAIDAIDDPEVLAALQTPHILRAAQKVMGKDVLARPPSFLELQATEKTLRGLKNAAGRTGRTDQVDDYSKALDTLGDVMRRRVPGYATAQAQYGAAKAAEKAFTMGERWWNKPAHLVRRELDKMPSGAARENARLAMAARTYDQLANRGGRLTKAQVERFTSIGGAARLRSMFKDPKDADAFLQEIERSGQAVVDKAKLVTTVKFLAAIGGVGAAGGLTMSLLD